MTRQPVNEELAAVIASRRKAIARTTDPATKLALRESLAILVALAKAERAG